MNELEINMHHFRGNAIAAGPLSDLDEIFVLLMDSKVCSIMQNFNIMGIEMWA